MNNTNTKTTTKSVNKNVVTVTCAFCNTQYTFSYDTFSYDKDLNKYTEHCVYVCPTCKVNKEILPSTPTPSTNCINYTATAEVTAEEDGYPLFTYTLHIYRLNVKSPLGNVKLYLIM